VVIETIEPILVVGILFDSLTTLPRWLLLLQMAIFCLHFKLKLKKIENGSFMEIYYKWYTLTSVLKVSDSM
jgi:hypothetical protein